MESTSAKQNESIIKTKANKPKSSLIDNMQVHTLGIHTIRYNIFEIIDEDIIVFPCGVFLKKFSLKQNKVIKKIKISNSVISSICRKFYFLVAFCYNGEGCVIDINSFEIVSRIKLNNVEEVSHLTVSSDMRFICVSCDYYIEDGKVLDGAAYVLERDIDDRSVEYRQVKLLKVRESLCEFYANTCDESLIILEKNLIEGTIPNRKSSNYFYIIREYNPDEDFKIKREKLLDYYDEISTMRKYENLLILHFSRRLFKLFNLENFNVAINIQFEGAGCIGSFDFINNKLFVTNISKILLQIDLEKELKEYYINNTEGERLIKIPQNKKLPVQNNIENEINKFSSYNILIGKEKHIKQWNYVIRVSEEMNQIFWANEHGLFGYDIENNHYILNLHSLIKSSGCGVTINKDNNHIAVGDLDNNITVFNNLWICDYKTMDMSNSNNFDKEHDFIQCPYKEEHLIFLRTQAKEAIRTVHWDEKLNIIYIGTMGGKIYQCECSHSQNINKVILNTTDKPNEEKMILLDDLQQTITCIKVYHLENLDFPILSVATTGGLLQIYKINSISSNIALINSFIAHSPQPDNDDLRFGSLKFKAEIWSLTSYPKTLFNKHINKEHSNFYMITSSEDQTIKIWEYPQPIDHNQPTLIKSFKNHDLAVTSVDWKPMKVLKGEVLASCSDDKTIQIYDPINNFELVKTLYTDLVLDWHTITYISLEENGSHLAVSTQNGFVVIFCLKSFDVVFCEKLHLGGIEGLCWKGNLLVTCGSDLNIGIIMFS